MTKETIKNLNTIIKDDFGNEITKGIFHIFCNNHNVYFDCRVGCLLCYEESQKLENNGQKSIAILER